MRAKRLAVFGAVAAGVLLVAAPASAVVTGPCDGSVTIGGVTYGPENDTEDDPIVIPEERSGLVAEWEGTTGVPIRDHVGSVGIVVGPSTIEITHWSGANAEDETAASGSYSLNSLPSMVANLTGIYEVTATHAGTGGSCSGSVMVLLEGNPLTTPVGAASVGGTLLAGAGMLLAGRGRAV